MVPDNLATRVTLVFLIVFPRCLWALSSVEIVYPTLVRDLASTFNHPCPLCVSGWFGRSFRGAGVPPLYMLNFLRKLSVWYKKKSFGNEMNLLRINLKLVFTDCFH